MQPQATTRRNRVTASSVSAAASVCGKCPPGTMTVVTGPAGAFHLGFRAECVVDSLDDEDGAAHQPQRRSQIH